MNLLSIDVDDFRVAQFESFGVSIPEDYVPTVPSLLPRVLESLATRSATATFFVQGWICRRWPELIRSLAEAGHEVASHGMTHRLVDRMPTHEFMGSLIDSRRLLEDSVGQPVRGYRSPCFSAGRIFSDVQRMLLDAGYVYDSSAHLGRRHFSGLADGVAPLWVRFPNGLFEFPLTTFFLGSRGLSVGSSFYTRRLPTYIHTFLIQRAAARAGGAHLYFHPNEIVGEPVPFRTRVSNLKSLIFIGNVRRGAERLIAMLNSHAFCSIWTLLERLLLRGNDVERSRNS